MRACIDYDPKIETEGIVRCVYPKITEIAEQRCELFISPNFQHCLVHLYENVPSHIVNIKINDVNSSVHR